jgi:hypothetical protein
MHSVAVARTEPRSTCWLDYGPRPEVRCPGEDSDLKLTLLMAKVFAAGSLVHLPLTLPGEQGLGSSEADGTRAV